MILHLHFGDFGDDGRSSLDYDGMVVGDDVDVVEVDGCGVFEVGDDNLRNFGVNQVVSEKVGKLV